MSASATHGGHNKSYKI